MSQKKGAQKEAISDEKAFSHTKGPPEAEGNCEPASPWDYSPAPEAATHWIAAIRPRYGLFIDGCWQASRSGISTDIYNPSNQTKLTEAAEANKADSDAAVQAAHKAYETLWSKIKPLERGKYIYRIARLLQDKSREFAVLESLNTGKPIRDTLLTDAPLAALCFFHYAGWADKLSYAFAGVTPRPLGVIAQLHAAHSPLLHAAQTLAAALACGNTVVLKPASTTPLTALALSRLCEEADLPPGVVNVITGGSTTGAALLEHPHVQSVVFGGFKKSGILIRKALAGKRKKLTLWYLETAAHLLFSDAPIDQAIEGLVSHAFANTGQNYCVGSQLFVEERIYDTVIGKLKERMATLRLGDPLDHNTDVGALRSAGYLQRVRAYTEEAEKEGAIAFCVPCSLPEKGYWFQPTILTETAPSYRSAPTELCGPLLPIVTFRTPQEAVDQVNKSSLNYASIWTQKGSKILWIADHLRASILWGNTLNPQICSVPFGHPHGLVNAQPEALSANLAPYMDYLLNSTI